MPTYDYDCDRCGPFSESHPIAEFDLPQPCPACGDPAPRALTLPAIGGAAPKRRVPRRRSARMPAAAAAAPRPVASLPRRSSAGAIA